MKTLVLFISIYFLLVRLSAQERQYVFTHLTINEGLLSDHVYSIMQDHKGFIWFGTAGGLQRYDGHKIVMFLKNSVQASTAFSDNISQVFEDRRHRFWVRRGSDIALFNPVKLQFKKVPIQFENRISKQAEYMLKEDRQGNVYLLITQFGLLPFDSLKGAFSSKEKLQTPTGWTVNAFSEDPATSNYWLGGDSGICIYNPATKEVYSKRANPLKIRALENSVLNQQVYSLCVDKSQKVWLTTRMSREMAPQVYCYDLATNNFTADTAGLNHTPASFVLQENGVVWTTGKLQEYLPQQRRFRLIQTQYGDNYGIKYGEVYCFFEDREHNIWLGTDKGVYIFNPERQPFLSILPGARDGRQAGLEITSFLQTSNGEIWVGSSGAGVFRYDSLFHILDRRPAWQGNASIWALYQQKQTNDIWMAGQSGSVAVFNAASHKNKLLKLGVFDRKTIRQITGDKQGNIWLATQYGRLVKWTAHPLKPGKNFTLIHDFNTIVYKLLPDVQGYLWVATHGDGLYKINCESGEIVQHFTGGNKKGESLYSDNVTDLLQLTDSTIALVSGCLNILNTNSNKIQFYPFSGGYSVTSVINVQKDQKGSLWLGSLSGIFRFNHRNITTTRYGYKDGILNTDFTPAASYLLADGKILLGTSYDFVLFNPGEVSRKNTPPPDVSITDFNLLNTYLVPDSILQLDVVRLNHKQNSITIEFAALSFLENDKITYYYKMDGFDKDWTRADIVHYARYTNLPAGDYLFQVRCENGNGVSCRNTTKLNIYIQPPFWQRWWFLLLTTALAVGTVYLVYRMRINQLLSMEKVRRRIARDLHDDMGSTLSTISILSEMAKQKVETDTVKTKEYIEKIIENSSRMMENMDDIVWSINPMNDSMARISARMREFSTSVLEAKNIDVQFNMDKAVSEVKLDMEARRDFFLLFKEAINNIAKYSKSSQVSIEVSSQDSELLMMVRDNGVGFDTANAHDGNGLLNMKKRAHYLKGTLNIVSEINKGTSIILRIPVE